MPWGDAFGTLPDVIDYESNARLVFHFDTNHAILSIDREFADHTSETYTGTAGHYRLTQVRDAQGRVTTLTYRAGSTRLESVVAPSGTMVFHYDTDDEEAETFLLIRSVSIGDREATFTYAHVAGESTGDGGVGPEGPLMLTGITDMGGITSTFEYGSQARGLDPHENTNSMQTTSIPDPTFLRFMNTPYGRTEFRTGWGLNATVGSNPARQIHYRRWLDVVYPGGERERLARQDTDDNLCTSAALCFPPTLTIPPTYGQALVQGTAFAPPTTAGYINARNSFYWDTTAFARALARNPSSTGAPESWDLNVHDAHTYHWLHAPPTTCARASSILESEEAAGELPGVLRAPGPDRLPNHSSTCNLFNMSTAPSALVTGRVPATFTWIPVPHRTQQDRSSVFHATTAMDAWSVGYRRRRGRRSSTPYNTAGDVTRVAHEVGTSTQELCVAAYTKVRSLPTRTSRPPLATGPTWSRPSATTQTISSPRSPARTPRR